MYWNRFIGIEPLAHSDSDFKSVVNHLDTQYKLGLQKSMEKDACGKAEAPISQIRKKALEFYEAIDLGNPPELFEITLDLKVIDDPFGIKTLTSYDWTRVYLVRVVADKSDTGSAGDSAVYEWYLLDGESTVLHVLNAKLKGIKIDDLKLAAEYLDFFCSFLCVQEGVFALIQSEDDLNDLENADLFEPVLFPRRQYAVFRDVGPYARVPWATVEQELRRKLKEKVIKSLIRLLQSKASNNQSASDGRTTNQRATQELKEGGKEDRLVLDDLVLFDEEVREASFEVTRSGKVTMKTDSEFLGDLQVRRHTTLRHGRSGVILFTKNASRKRVTAATFKDYVTSAVRVSSFYNVLIEESVRFDPTDHINGLECLDVHFLGRVTFDHCNVSAVFRFEDCKFLGGFHAPGANFNSQVSFKSTETYSLPEVERRKQTQETQDEADWSDGPDGAYPIALDMNHAKVAGSLTLERVTAYGSVSCRHLTVKADANFSGLQVLPLVDCIVSVENEKTSKRYKAARARGPVLLDLQRSFFAGSLNLGIWIDRDRKSKNVPGFERTKKPNRRRVTVCGDCRFDTMSIGKSLIIEGLAVVKPQEKEVDLSQLGSGAWDRKLSMSNIRVKGNIQSWEYDSWDLAGAMINPPLLVDGSIDLKWSRVEGYTDLRGSHVTGNLDCAGMRAAWLILEHSRLSDVEANDEARRRTEEVAWAKYSIVDPAYRPTPVGNAPKKWIDQFVERMSIIQGNLNLGNAIIPGGVQLRGVSIGKSIDVYLGAELGAISALPCFGIYTEFAETLEESGAKRQIPVKRTVVKQSAWLGRLSIRDSTLAGPLNLWGAKIGPTGTQVQNVAPKPVIDIATSRLQGGLYLHARSRWEGQETIFQLLGAGQHWRDSLESTEVHTEWTDHCGFRWIDPCGFVPEFQTFDVGLANYFWTTVSDVFHTTVNGDVDIQASEIGADLDLSNTHISRRVRLNDSYVKCDVRAVTCLEELDNQVTALQGSAQAVALGATLQTHCSCFEFQSLRCDGDLMLAGLAVAGKVDGRNAVVRGHGEFVYFDIDAAVDMEAEIKGDLNLCGFEVGLLKIGGRSFAKSGTIDLARATISTLEICGLLPEKLTKEINLQSIKVNHWEIMKSEQEKQEEAILRLLGCTKKHYDSWPYKSIENWLSAKGEDNAAKAVFRDKNWREWTIQGCSINKSIFEEAKLKILPALLCVIVLAGSIAVSVWPWSQFTASVASIWFFIIVLPIIFRIGSWTWHWGIKRWIWGRFMGFGTVLRNAVLLWLVLSIGLALVLSDSRNVQPTFAAINAGLTKIKFDDFTVDQIAYEIQNARDELKNQHPDEEEWGFWNHGFWLALDITVPLVPFNLHDEWEPRESSEKTFMPQWMPPKTLANCLTLISWIIWSLIATALAGAMWVRK